MMTPRPFIPKRLAARLRASYSKVDQARSYVAFAEATILDCMQHLMEYQKNPMHFAQLHYPAIGVPNSYPVQTNIARTTDTMEHKLKRMSLYLQTVVDSELHMEVVEREVIETLSILRPNTLGKVSWPAEPKSLAYYRQEHLQKFQNNRESYARNLIARQKTREEQLTKQKQENDALDDESEKLIEKALARMPKDKANVYRSVFEAMKNNITNNQFTLQEIMALANGDKDAFTPILNAVKQNF